jgi:hypothetical protein
MCVLCHPSKENLSIPRLRKKQALELRIIVEHSVDVICQLVPQFNNFRPLISVEISN